MATPFFSLLTVCGLDELTGHGGRGVSHVLSILDPATPEPDFAGYPPLQRTVLRFDDIVEEQPGKVAPTADHVAAVLAFGRSLQDGTPAEGHLLVHCHAGISRSTAAMATLLAQANPSLPEREVVDRLVAIRPQAWPNLRMIDFADAQLEREGRLIEATGRVYRRRLEATPQLADGLRQLGRARELELARRSASRSTSTPTPARSNRRSTASPSGTACRSRWWPTRPSPCLAIRSSRAWWWEPGWTWRTTGSSSAPAPATSW